MSNKNITPDDYKDLSTLAKELEDAEQAKDPGKMPDEKYGSKLSLSSLFPTFTTYYGRITCI